MEGEHAAGTNAGENNNPHSELTIGNALDIIRGQERLMKEMKMKIHNSDILFNQVNNLTNELNAEKEKYQILERDHNILFVQWEQRCSELLQQQCEAENLVKKLQETLEIERKCKNEQDILLKETTEQLEEERAQRILLSNKRNLIERLRNSQASFEVVITNREHAYNELVRQTCEAELLAEEQLKATLELHNRLFTEMCQKMEDQMRTDSEERESMTTQIMNMEKQIQQLTSRERGMANWRNLIRIKKLRRYLKRRQGLQSTSSPSRVTRGPCRVEAAVVKADPPCCPHGTAKPNDTLGC